ncbi:alpha/beta fold hydrolase [Novosphingobium sp. KN65.2]|uniref:alpha/beta fold hydrolase n=1 Tax=Novosphingobium sp. KN65.2 TaxID=1478134 RepID=UPI0005E912E1|nr:alpha/beta hydrolase [Novosphingobium sp. KN65.2]CDO36441.1 Alpha/beta hydrolase fold protein [Novosphingobium sp. KN65.2]
MRLLGDGLSLAADIYGPTSGQPVLFFHGGGQSHRSWRGPAQLLGAAGYQAIAVDLRGHGESDWATDGDYLLDAYARDVEALIDRLEGPVVLAGASRGGQSALVGGSRRPGRVALIMLADVAPALRDKGVDEIRAFFAASMNGFRNADAAADALSRHLGRERIADTSGLLAAMRRGEDGRLYWRWDPATVRPEFLHPPSEGEALLAAARRLRDPVVLVRAELSSIVTDESVALFRKLTPQLEVVVAHGVGHMFTGDQNDAFAETLLERLRRMAGG